MKMRQDVAVETRSNSPSWIREASRDSRLRSLRAGLGLACAGVFLTACGCGTLPRLNNNTARSSLTTRPPLSTAPGAKDTLTRSAVVPSVPPAVTPVALELPPLPGETAPKVSPAHFLPPAAISAPPVVPPIQPELKAREAVAADCLPMDDRWRRNQEAQSTELQQRLELLEKELAATKETLKQLTQALQASQTQIVALNGQLAHWQDQVRRVEKEMAAQQQADLKSLTELNLVLQQLLSSPELREARAP